MYFYGIVTIILYNIRIKSILMNKVLTDRGLQEKLKEKCIHAFSSLTAVSFSCGKFCRYELVKSLAF